MINIIMKCLMLAIVSFISMAVYTEQTTRISVERPWGLLLGDEVMVYVTFPEGHGTIDRNSLPQTNKRYGTWLYLKDLKITESNMRFIYQVVNVPKKNTEIKLPSYKVSDVAGNVIVVPTDSISIGPLLSLSKDENAILKLKPDHPPAYLETQTSERQLWVMIMVIVITGIILLFWHFGWRLVNRPPFSQAVHALSRLHRVKHTDPNQPARILHVAFNKTAGKTVIHRELNQMYGKAPWLVSLDKDIKHFYQTSERHFFSKERSQELNLTDVMKLAKSCRAKERLA